jgi:N6-adenosine-specific RNA methylase IME4
VTRLFSTIAADPPWRYDDSSVRGGVDHHYDTLSIEQICAMPVGELAAPDAHLYLWITNAFVIEGIGARVCRAWGFEPKTLVTWQKEDMAGAQIGLGRYRRNTTEHYIVAVRGRLPVQVLNLPTHFRAPRGLHSAKPEQFYRDVAAASPGPRLELFARGPARAGWSRWGRQAEGGLRLPGLDRAAA